jgi:hypothetical protein
MERTSLSDRSKWEKESNTIDGLLLDETNNDRLN